MNLAEILTYKIQTAPDGFGVEEVSGWLKDIPQLISFDDFGDLFDTSEFTQKDLFALVVIIRNKYINTIPVNAEFFSKYEDFSAANHLKKKYLELNIQEDKSRVLDLSNMLQLKKLVLSSNRVCETVILPDNSNLELIEIVNMPRLTRIENLKTNKKLKHLALRKCNKFADFNSLRGHEKLTVLDLSLNNSITDFNFLSKCGNIRILHLINTNAVKQKNITKILSDLKMLRLLSIKANQSELKKLRSDLPNCFIN